MKLPAPSTNHSRCLVAIFCLLAAGTTRAAQPTEATPADTHPTTRPAAASQPGTQDANNVARRVAELTRTNHKTLNELLAMVDESREASDRASVALDEIATNARFIAFLAKADRKTRTALRKLGKDHWNIVAGMFSENSIDVMSAMDATAELKSAAYADAETFVIQAIRSGDLGIRLAAVTAANRKDSSPRVADALVSVLVNLTDEDWRARVRYMGMSLLANQDPMRQIVTATSDALGTAGDNAAAGRLLAMLGREEYTPLSKIIVVCQTLAKMRKTSVVPKLVNLLQDADRHARFTLTQPAGFAGVQAKAELAESDAILWAIIELTGQARSPYGFAGSRMTAGKNPIYGFASPNDRDAAIDTFDKWWDKHRAKYEKKGK